MSTLQVLAICCLSLLAWNGPPPALANPVIYLANGGAAALQPALTTYSYGVHSNSLITPTQQQYHTQDDLGQYAYGYAEPHSTKQETRSLDGITRGTYSYRDAAGQVQTVDYTADAEGFHVAATNLPQAAPAFRQPTAGGPTAAAQPTTTTSPIAGPAGAAAESADTIELAAADPGHPAGVPAGALRLANDHAAQSQPDQLAADGHRPVELPDAVAHTHAVAIPRGKLIVPTTVVRPFAVAAGYRPAYYAAYPSAYARYLTTAAGGIYY